MKGQVPEAGREVPRLEVPEDVAVLYAWANLHGARYRDFSASRRESRAQVRQRAAEAQPPTEAMIPAQPERFSASTEPEEAGNRAERSLNTQFSEGADARKSARAVVSEKRNAPSHAREPHQSGLDSSFRQDSFKNPDSFDSFETTDDSSRPLATLTDPYMPRLQAPPARVPAGPPMPEEDMRPERFPQRRTPQIMVPSPEHPAGRWPERVAPTLSTPGLADAPRKAEAVAEPFPSPDARDRTAAIDHFLEHHGPQTPNKGFSTRDSAAEIGPKAPAYAPKAAPPSSAEAAAKKSFVERRSEPRIPLHAPEERPETAVPAWIHGQDAPAPPLPRAEVEPLPVMDTLQHSRERVASRWYALRGVFNPATPEMEPMQARARETASPLLAMFSPAGGVGKTSLTASLGRSLSALGEKVLLTDFTAQGILPFYYGATELRPGVMRTFSPPSGSADAPVSMLSYDVVGQAEAGDTAFETVIDQLARSRETYQHVLADVGPAAASVLKRLARLDATVLVPVAPDMNTVISLASMERFFAGMTDSAGRALQPRYLLMQFEATLPLHLDVREGLRQKLGHRLLPFVIRRSTVVSEALAEGMTVIDYAPESGVAADYRTLANWLRLLAAPGQPESRAARWSER